MNYAKAKNLAANPKTQINTIFDKKISKLSKLVQKEIVVNSKDSIFEEFTFSVWLDQNLDSLAVLQNVLTERLKKEFGNFTVSLAIYEPRFSLFSEKKLHDLIRYKRKVIIGVYLLC